MTDIAILVIIVLIELMNDEFTIILQYHQADDRHRHRHRHRQHHRHHPHLTLIVHHHEWSDEQLCQR